MFYAVFNEQNGGAEMEGVVQFFDDVIILTNTLNNTLKYSYSTLNKLIQSKMLMVILTKAKAGIIIERARFTVGNPDSFKKFIKDKLADALLKEGLVYGP